MRHQGPDNAVNPGIAGQESVGQLRQTAVIALGQMEADVVHLLFDDMEVIEQPFGRRGDRPLLPRRPRQRAMNRAQHPCVLAHPREKLASLLCAIDPLCLGEGRGVLLEPLRAEQLDPEGVFCTAGSRDPSPPPTLLTICHRIESPYR